MSTTEPQFLYMILVLPSLFGLTLVGDGLNKVIHGEYNGVISIVFGFMFIGVVVFAYFFFSSYVGHIPDMPELPSTPLPEIIKGLQ